MAVCPDGGTGLVPSVQTTVAATAWEAAGLVAFGPDDVGSLPAAVDECLDCSSTEDMANMALRNAIGHDKFGHRLSNALFRAGVESIAELRQVPSCWSPEASAPRRWNAYVLPASAVQDVRAIRLRR